MPVDVYLTRLAEKQVTCLQRHDRRSYDEFLRQLRAQGCKALGYRLTGEGLTERLCAAHLAGPLRLVVAFEAATTATILLVAPHHSSDPHLDVYHQLYQLAGLEHPPAGRRAKPLCCGDDGIPPAVDHGVLDELERRARALARGSEKAVQPAGRRGR